MHKNCCFESKVNSKFPPLYMAINTNLKLRKFNMSLIGNNKVVVFLGKRDSGKTSLVLDFLQSNKDIPIGTVISPTDQYNENFKNHVPEMFIHNEINPNTLETFLARQRKQCKRALEDPSIDPRAFLILDDCLADSKLWVNDRNIKFLFMNGRHVKVTLIITLQDPVGIPPKLRSNIDWVFVCKDTTRQNRKKIHEMYAGMFPTFSLFEDTMMQVCDNYKCLCLFKNSQSYKLEDQVFWYKADVERTKHFRICRPEYWRLNEEFKKKYMQTDDNEKHTNAKKTGNVIVHTLEQTMDKPR